MREAEIAERRGWVTPRPHEWVLIAAGMGLVFRYRWLIDDSFIYFRYVDNLLFLRIGLVFNAGEYVEGFSSPLQVMLLLPLRALGLDWFDIITGLGIGCFAVFGLLLVKLNRELSPTGAVFNLPLAVLSTGYGTTTYFTSGLETPMVHVVAAALALRLIGRRTMFLTTLVAVAPLVRPELTLAVSLAIAFCWWRERSLDWRLVALTVAVNGLWLGFRIYYYADLLPNTFYLKDDADWAAGLEYVRDLFRGVPVLPVAAALGVGWLLARLRGAAVRPPAERVDPRWAMLVVALLVGTYVVRIGGAELHYWYLAFPYTLCVCASAGWVERISEELLATRWRRQSWLAAAAGVLALCVAADKPAQLASHPFFGGELNDRIGLVADASYHRQHPSLRPASWRGQVRIERMREFAPHLAHGGYRDVITGIWCRTHWARFRSRVVHGFGLTDPILARVRALEMIPGHKPRLVPLAADLARLRESGSVRPGVARAAVSNGTAPAWIANNLDTIEIVERKMGNRHRLLENLALAFTFPPPIALPERARVTGAPRAPDLAPPLAGR